MSDNEYTPQFFKEHMIGEPLPLLDKVCRDGGGEIDCAVMCGMYRPIADDLRKCDFDLRLQASRRWFCHNHPDHACRGNALVQGRDIVRAIAALDDPTT